MDIPADLKYTENDEWVRVGGNIGTIGITDYAQEQLSDIVYLEITSTVGEELGKGETIAEVESVKAAAYVYMPVAGRITEVNDDLTDNPEMVNSAPYSEAWVVKFEIIDPAELEGLIDAAAYEKRCLEREH